MVAPLHARSFRDSYLPCPLFEHLDRSPPTPFSITLLSLSFPPYPVTIKWNKVVLNLDLDAAETMASLKAKIVAQTNVCNMSLSTVLSNAVPKLWLSDKYSIPLNTRSNTSIPHSHLFVPALKTCNRFLRIVRSS